MTAIVWSLHCECGASFEGATDDADAMVDIGAYWQSIHRGVGHSRVEKERAEHVRAEREGWLSEVDEL